MSNLDNIIDEILQDAKNESEKIVEDAKSEVANLVGKTESEAQKNADKIIEKAKTNKIDWNNISLEKTTKAFDESISSISSIKGIIRIMTYSIILRWYCNTFNDINIMDKRKNT